MAPPRRGLHGLRRVRRVTAHEQGKACFVELNKVRILGVQKNSWNGKCITRHRVLSSVENVNREGGTTIKMLERPTSDNLSKMTFAGDGY